MCDIYAECGLGSVTNKPFMLNVIMLDGVKLSVVMLNVVAPSGGTLTTLYFLCNFQVSTIF